MAHLCAMAPICEILSKAKRLSDLSDESNYGVVSRTKSNEKFKKTTYEVHAQQQPAPGTATVPS